MPIGENHLLRFGPYQLDTQCGQLRKNGFGVKLQGQPVQILEILLEHPGELVTREELRQRLWSTDTFVDFDHSLNTAIKRLRQALGEDAETPKYVETIPKRGYRFAGEVLGDDTDKKDLPPLRVGKNAGTITGADVQASTAATNKSKWPRVRGTVAISTLAVAGILAAVLWITRPVPVPRIVGSHVLTKTGIGTFITNREPGYFQQGSFLIDRGSVYLQEETSSGRVTMQISTAGGEPLGSVNVKGFLSDISRDGSELLSVTREGSTCDVWEQSLPVGTPRLVIQNACSPRWSVDGRNIFFTRNNATELYRASADGTRVEKLATVPRIVNPHLSPDGSRIRFVGVPAYTMWEVGADGSNPHPILNGFQDVFGGSWTPDGRYYFFTSWDGDRSSLWVVSEEHHWWKKRTSIPQQLTFGPLSILAPTISKDGKQLHAVGIGRRGELSAYDSRVGKFTPYLGGESICMVNFSRDGQWMAYVTYPEGTLWRSRIDGSERRQLTVPPLAVLNPRWSPDGRLIAFWEVSNGDRRSMTLLQGPQQLYVVSADGGAPMLLLAGYYGDPTWSPDGRSIAYHSLQYWAAEVRILDLQSQKSTTVPGSQGFYSPRWSPDGKYLAALGGSRPINTKLMLFSFETNAWQELAACTDCDWPSWSHDSKFVYAVDRNSLLRIAISNHDKQQIASLQGFRATSYYFDRIGFYWFGLTPDERPLTTRDTGIQEIYAFDLEYK